MVIYLGDSTVRALLSDTADARPGLEVRSAATEWRCARPGRPAASRSPAPSAPSARTNRRCRSGRRGASTRPTPRSSRATAWVGIATVGSTGKVQVKQVRAATVAEGEFAAIAMVLTRLKRCRSVETVDNLTDSLTAARVLNAGATRPGAGDHERLCLRWLEQVRGTGVVEVRVSWVRGHDGNALNELADRAAVAAQRCGQWGQPTQGSAASIRAELHELLDAADVRTFVPATPPPREAAGAAWAIGPRRGGRRAAPSPGPRPGRGRRRRRCRAG